MKTFPTLYKRNNSGKIQQWTINVLGNHYYVVEGLVDGKLTQTKPHTCEAKSSKKKNSTTAEQQAEKEAQSKYENKLEHGYCLTQEGIDDTGYQEPMLAKQFYDYWDKIFDDLFVDDKLNGVRCNYKKAGELISRKNKPFNTAPHIIAELDAVRKKYPKIFVDGELFNPALKENLNRLIELVSVAYKPTDVTPELLAESKEIVQFWVYDGYGFEGITPKTPFTERRAALQKLFKGFKYIRVLNYVTIKNGKDKKVRAAVLKQVKAMLKEVAKAKGEGIIIRHGLCPYEHKRSKYLLKAKNFIDDEFEILKVEEGNGDWVGCAKRITLKLHKPVVGRDGKIQTDFASNIEGNRTWLGKMWKELDTQNTVIGKMANCEFQGYSEYGIPQIGYVRSIRDYE